MAVSARKHARTMSTEEMRELFLARRSDLYSYELLDGTVVLGLSADRASCFIAAAGWACPDLRLAHYQKLGFQVDAGFQLNKAGPRRRVPVIVVEVVVLTASVDPTPAR